MIFTGTDQIFFVLLNEEYVRVAFIEDHTWSEDTAFLSGVTRLSGGWDVGIPLSQSFSVAVRMVQTRDIIESDILVRTSLDQLRVAKRDRTLLNFKIESLPQGHIRTFKGYISSITEGSPSGRFVRINLTIRGEGQPAEILFEPPQDNGVSPWTFGTTDTYGSTHTIWND